jgi:pimeloyl-ACP methyl ester carboxylesterase
MQSELGTLARVSTPRGTLRYWEWGEGRTILFLHGIGVNPLLWRNVVAALAQDFRCVCPELPLGAHRTPMPNGADLSPPGVADLVNDFLEALDLTEVTVVGNDTGGAIAQLLVTRHPDRVARLVLTPSDAFEDFLPPLFRYLQWGAWVPGVPWTLVQSLRIPAMRRLPIAFGKLTKRPIPREVTDVWVKATARFPIRRDLARFLRQIKRRYTLDAARKLRDFNKPALIVWPKDDPVFKFRNAQRLAQILPQAKLVTIEDSYGFVPEDQPERLATEIREFLSGTQPALRS